ncbi:MAG TPA: hypothetical protein VF678_07305 [bacterium]
MRRTRLLVLCSIALLAFSGMVQAQVAAPALTPGTIDLPGGNPGFTVDPSFVPNNPAVMNWNGSSVLGIGQARLDRDQKAAGTKTDEYAINYAGLRWTGDKFAVGLETGHLAFDSGNTLSKVTVDNVNVGLSGKVAEWLSIGVAANNAKTDGSASKDTFGGFTVGATARLGDIFFVGLGIGSDSDEHKETGNNYNDSRATSQWGIGLYTGGGKGGSGNNGAVWHLEYSVEDKGDITDANGNKSSGYTRSSGTVEVIWKHILLSYVGFGVDAKTGNTSQSGSAVEAGWVGDKGLYVTVRVQNSTQSGNSNQADSNTQAINIGLQW